MSINFLAELAMAQFRVWVRSRSLKAILKNLTCEIHNGAVAPTSYLQLRNHCQIMMDIIDQLAEDPSSIVSLFVAGTIIVPDSFLQSVILSDSTAIGRQFQATFEYVYFEDPGSPFLRAKELRDTWPGLFLPNLIPTSKQAGRSFVRPEHLDPEEEAFPFLNCSFHQIQSAALIITSVGPLS